MSAANSRPTRVAFFHPCLIHGGIQRVFVNLARGFLEHGLAVDLVQATPEGDFRDQVPSGVRLIDLNATRALTSIVPLARYLRREVPDFMISGAIQTNIAAVLARRLARAPTRLMLTEHNPISVIAANSRMLRTSMTPWLVRHTYLSADKLVAVSHGAAEDLAAILGIPIERVDVIYNPVIGPDLFARMKEPLEHPWFVPGEPPVILAVGRLHYQKDYPTLIRAFAQLRHHMRTRLLLLGDGEDRPSLEELSAQASSGIRRGICR